MSAPFAAELAGASDAADSGEAARQLEAYFLRRVLAEVKIGQSGMLSGGFAGETFQKMYADAIADAMAEAGGLGISDVIMGQLEGEGVWGERRSPPNMINDAARLADRPPPSLRASGSEVFAVPVAGRQSSGFGSRIHPISGERKFHAGIDIAAKTGTAASAAAAGVVSRASRAGGYGNLVVIKHPGGLETRYAHLDSIDVAVGDHVRAGERVGAVGQTGTATGPHLHFEVRKDGVALDPVTALARNSGLNHADLLTTHKLRKKPASP